MTEQSAPQNLDTIQSYHAHIYFEGERQRAAAEAVRGEISQRFSVLIGRWHDTLVGPHTRSMYQVAFKVDEFSRLVPWLMINRRGLSILVHPNTGRPRLDHLEHAIWLGEKLDVDLGPLPDHATEAEAEIVPNTTPVTKP